MSKFCPVLMVKDVKEALAFYKDVFGFEVTLSVPDEENAFFLAIEKNGVEIMLEQQKYMVEEFASLGGKEIGGTFTMYMDLGEVKPLYDACVAKGVKFIADLHKTPYGQDEFAVLDKDGYIVVITKR